MKAIFRILSLVGLLTMPLVSWAMLQNGQIEFGTVKGKASLINPKAEKKLAEKGLVFEEGYRVDTGVGSTSELILSNGATLVLSPNTSMEVRTFRQVGSDLIKPGQYQLLDKEPSPSVTEVFVKRGKITGEVRKLNPQSTFTIKTPVGVARVRGTVYTVEYSQNNTKGVGNIKVSVVRGLVEVVVNGTNSGPQSVVAGRQMSAQGSVDIVQNSINSVKTSAAVVDSKQLPKVEGAAASLSLGDEVAAPGVPKGTKVVSIDADGTITLSNPVTLPADAELVVVNANSSDPFKPKVDVVNSTKMQAPEGGAALQVGDVIIGPGIPSGTKVIAIDSEGNITLSKPVTITAGTELVAATAFTETPIVDRISSTQAVNSSSIIPSVDNHSTLSVGDVVTGFGIPEGTKVVAVAEDGTVTLSKPVNISPGTEIEIKAPDQPPPIVPTIVNNYRMNSDQISSIANTLATGSSLAQAIVAAVADAASKAPPPPPLNLVDSNTSTGGGTNTDTGGGSTPDDGGGTPATGGGTPKTPTDNVTDAINKVIDRQAENPSPAGG